MELKNYMTPLEIVNYDQKIHHSNSILSIGSCFSNEIGNKLLALEFNIAVNPFGTLFNPISIFQLLECCINKTAIKKAHIVQSNGLYYHYQWHSSIYGTSEEELIQKITTIQSQVRAHLKTCNHLILTFGTAIIHEYKTEIIANCHKQPRTAFIRRFLTLDELKNTTIKLNKLLLDFNPNIQIITTTSPIRHTKEGLVDNTRSKALLSVYNQWLEQGYKHIRYFPSYELLLDVLRDYRFYKSDLIHPNQQAIDEIWTYFLKTLVCPSSTNYISKMEKYLQMKSHKIMFPESDEGQKFKQKIKDLYQEIQSMK